tara:strand:- start:3852 stop:4139 length:288 start_codon:yes stop_codon:yes gene_type:complete
MKFWVALGACMLLSFASNGQIDGEQIIGQNGVYTECGNAEGLSPCRDINGETYQEELAGPAIEQETSAELSEEADRISHESPAELERTIEDMERH